MALRSFHLGMPCSVMPSYGFNWSPTLSGRGFRPIILVLLDLRAAEHPTLRWLCSFKGRVCQSVEGRWSERVTKKVKPEQMTRLGSRASVEERRMLVRSTPDS